MENGSPNGNNSPDHKVVAVVQRIITERCLSNAEPIRKERRLVEFGLTSLDLARLVLLVEDEFELRIPVRDLIPANFSSILTISQLVSRLIEAQK